MANKNEEILNKDLISTMERAVESYQTTITDIISYCKELEKEEGLLVSKLSEDIGSIDFNVNDALSRIEEKAHLEKESVEKRTTELSAELAYYESLLIGQGLYSEERKSGLLNLRIAIETAQKGKKQEVTQLLQINKEQLETAPQKAKEQLLEKFELEKERILKELKEKIADLAIQESTLFNQYYETVFDVDLLNQAITLEKQPLSYLNVGSSTYYSNLFEESIPVLYNHLIPFFHKKNILLKHEIGDLNASVDIVNCIIARSLMSCKPGKMKLHLIDPVNKGRNFRKYSKLVEEVKTIYTKEKEMDKLFKELDKVITKNFQNFLRDDHENLADYNLSQGKDESYQLVVVMNYPEKISRKSLKRLKGIIHNGPIAGINAIIIGEREIIDIQESKGDSSSIGFESFCNIIDLEDSVISDAINIGNIDFFTEEQIDIPHIISYINDQLTLKDESLKAISGITMTDD